MTAPVPLTPGELACRDCGIAVPGPHLRADVLEVSLGVRWHGQTPRPLVVAFTACEACRVRRDHADALVELYPAVAAAQGTREVAALRFAAALAVGELVRAPINLDGSVSGNVAAVGSARELALLLRHVVIGAPVGDGVSAPAPAMALAFSRDAEARQGVASPSPWAHVSPELRTTARDGMTAWLRARVAPRPAPVAVPVPFGADVLGCALCGVGTARAWRKLNVSPRALGGRSTAQPLAAAACPTCAEAIGRYGVGRTALAAALLAHAGVRRLGGVDDLEVGLVAFAAQPTGTPPTATPFEGVDFDALRGDLARSGVTA